MVGTLWSATARVNFGCLTFLFEFLRLSKACGLVTSCIKCLSTNNKEDLPKEAKTEAKKESSEEKK